MNVKVSVIIPVYNVEEYISRCAHSLFAQTLDDMEFIFVDDCTQDNSIKIIETILEGYPHRKKQVRFIKHEVNEGLAKSRQDGIQQAVGDYIIHCDSDDWVELDMYEALYDAALKTNADIIVCDFFEENLSSTVIKKQIVCDNKKDMLKAILNGDMHSAVWNKLVKRHFLLSYPYKIPTEIFMWEDMALMVPLLIAANKIVKLDKVLYHYATKRVGSITSQYDARKTDSMLRSVEYIENCLKDSNKDILFKEQLNLLTLRASAGLISQKGCWNPELWRKKNSMISIPKVFRSNMWWTHKVYASLAMLRLDFVIKFILRIRTEF